MDTGWAQSRRRASLVFWWSLCWTDVNGWMTPTQTRLYPSSRQTYSMRTVLYATGADIEQDEDVVATGTSSEAADSLAPSKRGKVNEIDFCIAPADVSLSRAYGPKSNFESGQDSPLRDAYGSSTASPTMSLTRALNNASNRAVRRIILSRSWPSVEALNLSLRQVSAVMAERKSKCPVPQPILNVLTRSKKSSSSSNSNKKKKSRSRTDAEYVADQIVSFREKYDTLAGYQYAEDYLESVLSLATVGVESSKVTNVLKDGVYDESYRRMLGVLGTAGINWVVNDNNEPRSMLKTMTDQDICLSMMDKIIQQKDGHTGSQKTAEKGEEEPVDDEDTTRGVLIGDKEPTVTRVLNKISNIAQRALLFGGDQELLVIAETLDADRKAFIERWYPDNSDSELLADTDKEVRPGVQYLNCIIQLLRTCYTDGVVTSLDPPLPLLSSYAYAYERLVASAVELGSGYLKPAAANDQAAAPIPRTAQEELGRFALWESRFRQQSSTRDVSSYPEDLEGSWQVRDEISGETIGSSTVKLLKEGDVEVAEPLQGLRWRLDPGPTHLDTCTFQILGDDGTILQYRGFIDRGARLEARFSKRSITIRGSVQFQMRDGNIDYYKDILPINYREGTTKFVMTKLS